MESYARVEREASELEREAAALRELQARLSDEILTARAERLQLAERDTSRWHHRRFAVLVWVSVLAVVVAAIVLAGAAS